MSDYQKLIFNIEKSTVKEIDRLCKKRRMNRSEVIRMMIDLGLDCHRDLENLGVIPLMDFFHFVKKSTREKGMEVSKGKQLNLID